MFTDPSLFDWPEQARELLARFSADFRFGGTPAVYGSFLPAYKCATRILVAVHPLWDMSSPSPEVALGLQEAAQAAVQPNGPPLPIEILDTFSLLRRPGECYQWIVEPKSSI